MILHNNFYLKDGQVNLFKYKNIENFSFGIELDDKNNNFSDELSIKLSESLDFNNIYTRYFNENIHIKLHNIYFTLYTKISTRIFFHYVLRNNKNIITFVENTKMIRDAFLDYINKNNLFDVYIFYNEDLLTQIQDKLEKIFSKINCPEDLKRYYNIFLFNVLFPTRTDFNKDINVKDIYFTEIKKSIIDNFTLHIDYLNKCLQIIKEDNLNTKEKSLFLPLVFSDARKTLFNKNSIKFLSDKNKLIFEKYDINIDISEDINNFLVIINKSRSFYSHRTNIINEIVEKKLLKYIDKKIKEGESIKSLILLNFIMAINGNNAKFGEKGNYFNYTNSDFIFPQFLLEKVMYFYFLIFKDLEEYDFIIENYSIFDTNVDIMKIACDSYIEKKDFENLKELLNKMKILAPSLGYIKTTLNMIEREEKINSFSNENDKIDNLTGEDFEKILTEKFNELGFFAEQTKGSGDFGADIIVETINRTRIIIQCKRFKSKVNLKAVQEVIGAVGHYEADYGIVITNNEFLNSAKKLAKSNDIELWDRNSLSKFLKNDISFSIITEL